MSLPLISRVRERTRGHGQHRAVDEVARLRAQMYPLLVLVAWLIGKLREATAARDTANAKVSRLGEIEAQLAETTHQLTVQTAELRELRAFKANHSRTGDLRNHPAVAETQPIPVVSLASTNLAVYAPMRLSAAAEAGLI
ncbi:hypothetical protein AB0M92_18770 [Streptomyces sp. NPDC051582]|uniref:hypothetical protein n=1 Tax=Streptomyces sp. NPDC051582 TaxID=3155167 RepID=UPI003435CDD5